MDTSTYDIFIYIHIHNVELPKLQILGPTNLHQSVTQKKDAINMSVRILGRQKSFSSQATKNKTYTYNPTYCWWKKSCTTWDV